LLLYRLIHAPLHSALVLFSGYLSISHGFAISPYFTSHHASGAVVILVCAVLLFLDHSFSFSRLSDFVVLPSPPCLVFNDVNVERERGRGDGRGRCAPETIWAAWVEIRRQDWFSVHGRSLQLRSQRRTFVVRFVTSPLPGSLDENSIFRVES